MNISFSQNSLSYFFSSNVDLEWLAHLCEYYLTATMKENMTYISTPKYSISVGELGY